MSLMRRRTLPLQPFRKHFQFMPPFGDITTAIIKVLPLLCGSIIVNLRTGLLKAFPGAMSLPMQSVTCEPINRLQTHPIGFVPIWSYLRPMYLAHLVLLIMSLIPTPTRLRTAELPYARIGTSVHATFNPVVIRIDAFTVKGNILLSVAHLDPPLRRNLVHRTRLVGRILLLGILLLELVLMLLKLLLGGNRLALIGIYLPLL
jgi:hypothetical protein